MRPPHGAEPFSPRVLGSPRAWGSPRAFLRALFDAVVAAAQPRDAVRKALAESTLDRGSFFVLAAGKAAPAMAEALLGDTGTDSSCSGIGSGPQDNDGPRRGGLMVSPTLDPPGRQVVERALGLDHRFGAHPVPSDTSAEAGALAMALAGSLGTGDRLLVLLSGGASALLSCPLPGLPREALFRLNAALLASGLPIGDVNTVRRHVSRLAGGRLAAAAWPAHVTTFAVSDVPGDVAHDIGSGPTVPDPTTCLDAREIVQRAGLASHTEIMVILADPRSESLKPGDPRLSRQTFEIVVSPSKAYGAGLELARTAGLTVHDLGDQVTGDAGQVASRHARIASALDGGGHLLLSAGELTITLKPGHGQGGPNQHYALSLAQALAPLGRPFHVLAADTDGRDGVNDGPAHAGGFADQSSCDRAQALGLNLAASLERQDSATVLKSLGDALITGATGTNVNDVRALLLPAI